MEQKCVDIIEADLVYRFFLDKLDFILIHLNQIIKNRTMKFTGEKMVIIILKYSIMEKKGFILQKIPLKPLPILQVRTI